ncbi:acetylornithine transaminase [Actinocorallia sp. API 0066]|uniref:acetylornithine transaminase n=1 Tax=Actinocorallia sp. API 0066 TaxID=2896846 RepID=UPI001E593758|nr:acetylornithine transaminase [Actinocorallia sp. API 0066]MCD0450701.1 acetylornithine transaminase [Actinocorallia sp. API 0066]
MTWQDDFKAAFMPNRPLPPLVLERGEGRTVWDVEGNAYLDMFAGIAVSSLGHNHPALVAAVTAQIGKIAHVSPLLTTEPEIRLAGKLVELLGLPGKVYFGNSGTEANEAAFKMVRKHAGPDKYLVATENGFHGRTMGALSLTGKKAIREPFAPYGVDVRFVPYSDADALKAAVTDECAAVFLEPTQGEAGVVPPPDGYLTAARAICDETGALLVLDEIQSGVGRTGRWFAHQHEGVRPDILTLAKGLGGGVPIGAVVGVGAAGDIFALGDHGCTFGGNPLSASAALAVLETVERDGLMDHAVKIGARLSDGISALRHPLLAGVRGRGLWLGVLLTAPVAADVRDSAQEAGFLVNNVQPDAVRLAPALTMTEDEADSFVAALPAILDGVGS